MSEAWDRFVEQSPEAQVTTVLATLRAVVAEYGDDYKYQPPDTDGVCYYVHDDGEALSAGCIVGHVANRLGMSLVDMVESGNGGGISSVSWAQHLAPRARSVLARAQNDQDTGSTWGEALRHAEKLAAY